MRVALSLRSVSVDVEIDLHACGEACLVRAEEIAGALPAGMGQAVAGARTDREYVLRTTRNTLLKRRKHTESAVSEFFGVRYSFDLARQEAAFDRLRNSAPGRVSRPLGECACCYEVEQLPGKLPCPRSSVLSAHLASKYPVHRFRDAAEAERFVERSWTVLGSLHALGIQHGDPAFYNFLIEEDQVGLIDLDDALYTGESASSWDTGVFILHTMVPVLTDFFPLAEVAERVQRMVPDLPTQERSLLGLAISGGAKYNEAALSFAVLRLQRQAERLYTEDLAARSKGYEGRIAELEGMAAERLDAIREMDLAVRTLRAESERRAEGMSKLTVILEAKETRIQELESVAGERLLSLQALDAEARRSRADADERAASLEQMAAIVAARDVRVRELEGAAAERLRALEKTDAALRALEIEAGKRAAGLENLTAVIASRDHLVEELEQTAAARLRALEETDAALRALEIEAGKRLAGLEELTAIIALRDRTAQEIGAERDRALGDGARLREELDRSRAEVLALRNENPVQFLRRKLRRADDGRT